MKLRLIQTCGACPEQYSVYRGEDLVGEMRLRYGCFTVRYYGEVVYTAMTKGDGIFIPEERHTHLNAGCEAILAKIPTVVTEKLYTIEMP